MNHLFTASTPLRFSTPERSNNDKHDIESEGILKSIQKQTKPSDILRQTPRTIHKNGYKPSTLSKSVCRQRTPASETHDNLSLVSGMDHGDNDSPTKLIASNVSQRSVLETDNTNVAKQNIAGSEMFVAKVEPLR